MKEVGPKWYHFLLIVLVFVIHALMPSICRSEVKKRFVGEWVTNEGRNLDGIMTCDITKYKLVNAERKEYEWTGRFYGVWQGQYFTYTVKFKGPIEKMRGKATIDGASYDWVGSFTHTKKGVRFVGKFTGSRYGGWFNLYERKL